MKKKNIVSGIILYLSAFLVMYCITLKQSYMNIADVRIHMQHGSGIRTALSWTPYPVWHWTTAVLFRVGIWDLNHAAAVASGLFSVFYAGVVRWYLGILGDKFENKWILDVISLTLIFVGPLYFPSFSSNYYLGVWSPNIWHNPTTNAVKPFALLIVILTVKFLNIDSLKQKIRWSVVLSVLLFISTLAKPAFAQIYFPAFFVVECISYIKIKSFKAIIYETLFLLPTLILFGVQFIASFGVNNADTGGIQISWLEAWHMVSSNCLVSFLLLIAFPLGVMSLHFKTLYKDKLVSFSWLLFAFGTLEWALLIEGGIRAAHANFSWGYSLASSIVWVVMTGKFVFLMKNSSGIKRFLDIGLVGLYLWHLILGIRYYIYLMTGPFFY